VVGADRDVRADGNGKQREYDESHGSGSVFVLRTIAWKANILDLRSYRQESWAD
jgi:hypothetical protein